MPDFTTILYIFARENRYDKGTSVMYNVALVLSMILQVTCLLLIIQTARYKKYLPPKQDDFL